MSLAIELEALTVTYGDRPAVSRLDLAVRRGEWLALIGPNGAGKSTVLRAIAGIVAHRGSVRLEGTDASRLHPRERAKRVALVPQVPVVPQPMSVADYVLLGRTPFISFLGSPGARDREIAAQGMEDLDLRGFDRRPLGSLSGGELQRAVLARAIAQTAPVLLLDEPTSWLDVGHQQQVLELVDGLRLRDGLTVLSVMHDLTLAGQFAERFVLMAAGEAVASGTAHEVLTEDSISRHYGAAVRVLADTGDGRLAVLPRRAAAR
jgi:iron complex transport system ATP-binding protein